jgi:hypothetical protein
MKMYVMLDKEKPHTENIKGLNLAAVIYTTFQVSRPAMSKAAPAIYFSGALRKHIIWADC